MRGIAITLLLGLCSFCCMGQTVFSGKVLDEKTGEVLPYVNVSLFKNGKVVGGTTTGEDGNFKVVCKTAIDSVHFSFIGYFPYSFVTDGRSSKTINVKLKPESVSLEEAKVTAKRQRYKRKGNPAVEIMKEVLKHKELKRPESEPFYEMRSHIKTEISILGLKDSLKNKGMFKNMQYVFDNVQTSPLSEKKYLPVYFMEQLKEYYYRKEPKSRRTVLMAQKDVEVSKFLDPQSLESLLNEVVSDVDLYEDKIHILSNDFVSPLSGAGVTLYHFYLGDTVDFNGKQCVKILFNPANARDIGFSGTLWISLADSTYSLLHSELGVHKMSGVNFVEELSITQTYDEKEGKIIKQSDDVNAELSIYGIQLFLRKKTVFGDYVFGRERDKNVYGSLDLTERVEGYNKRLAGYWDQWRIEPLTESEVKTYSTAAQLNNYRAYKVALKTLMAFTSGYVEIDKIDVGALENTISWNDVEGLRLRVGGKTNMNFSKHLFFEGFLAYGFKDERFKFRAKAMYNFADKLYNQWEFPKNLISVWYEENTRIHGQSLLMGEPDRLFLSFNRGSTNKMSFDKILRAEYEVETQSQFSMKFGVQYLQQQPLANLKFVSYDGSTSYDWVKVPSVDVELRYAKGERFYQQQQYRLTINTTSPIYTLNYSYGGKIMGSDWEYHKIKAMIQKRWFVWTFGYADVELEAGKIFGNVPFPLMFVHHANQNWAYQDEAFNLMNYYEFVSDGYAQVIFNYCFNGYILNRIPLIKHLNWREVFAVKALWGEVTDSNYPSSERQTLMDFPNNGNHDYTTFRLNGTPYVEANIGVDNIFKVLRLDYVRRFTYLDNPDIAKWGIRFRLRFTF